MTILRLSFALLLMLASLGFTFLAAKTLKQRGIWEKQVANLGAQLDKQTAERDQLLNGDFQAQITPLRPDEGKPIVEQLQSVKAGLRQMHVSLHDALVDRGPMWDQCTRGTVDASTGEVKVTIAEPSPHGIKDGTMLFAFEKADLTSADSNTGGHYLGEFKVTGADKQSIVLAPAQNFSPRRLEQIAASKSEWLLYEVMPSDRHSAFYGLEDNELIKLIPAATRGQYLNDGREANESTPADQLSRVWVKNEEGRGQYDLVVPEEGAAGKGAEFKPNASGSGTYDLVEGKFVDGKLERGKFYDRHLRDYSVAMRELHRQIWELNDAVLATNNQVESVKQAINGLSGEGGQVADRDKEIATLKEQLDRVNRERELVKKYSDELTARIAEIQGSIERLSADNQRLAEEYATWQLDAASRATALTGAR
jgi:prefoldin subunit 5